MDFGERTTGTRDEHYDLISVLYHALHGAENCETYALDAEAAGDERLAGFFRDVQAQQTRLAGEAKRLLGIRTVATPGTAEVGTEIPSEGRAERERRPGTAAPPHGAIGPAEAGPEVPPPEAPPPSEERPERRSS